MKIFAKLVAISAFGATASAFVPATPAFTATSLAVRAPGSGYEPATSNYNYGTNQYDRNRNTNLQRNDQYNDRELKRAQNESQTTSNLMARLAALENNQTNPRYSRRNAGEPKYWDTNSPEAVQGGSLKTWSFASTAVDRVQVVLETEGRPLDADIELWQGPDNTPHKMRVYVENGSLRPFKAVIETPRGPNTIAIRNTGQLEFPLTAYVCADRDGPQDARANWNKNSNVNGPMNFGNTPRTIQGGALRTYPFEPHVDSVEVLLKTDGRPLNARIELLQGPNNNKEVIELYTEDGMDRPFFVVLETPGSGNVVRVVNSATVEFPMTAVVQPHAFVNEIPGQELKPVIGGDMDDTMRGRGGSMQW